MTKLYGITFLWEERGEVMAWESRGRGRGDVGLGGGRGRSKRRDPAFPSNAEYLLQVNKNDCTVATTCDTIR